MHIQVDFEFGETVFMAICKSKLKGYSVEQGVITGAAVRHRKRRGKSVLETTIETLRYACPVEHTFRNKQDAQILCDTLNVEHYNDFPIAKEG